MIDISTIYLASSNKHKLKEISQIFRSFGMDELTMPNFTLNVEEHGKSFEENALIKAMAYGKKLQKTTFADDSGLIVDALPNELGLYSARYKPELSQAEKNLDIIKRLKDIPKNKRTARFISTAVLYDPIANITLITKGIMEGHIAEKISGTNGFGYDPIFIPLNYTTSVAELDDQEKNQISHRYKSIAKLVRITKSIDIHT